MDADQVVAIHTILQEHGIGVWVDGGWAVDALLGEQTRPHNDLDIVVETKDELALRELLGRQGYAEIAGGTFWNFVLSEPGGLEVDVHVITLDHEGNGIYGPAERGVMYPAASLTGSGTVAGRAVKCISPEYLVGFHTGYPLTEQDFRDVYALHERFGVELPEEYRR